MFPVDAFRKTLGKAVDVFQRHSIRFHLTGGITTIAYGEPRLTHDLDLVIENRAVAAQLDVRLAQPERMPTTTGRGACPRRSHKILRLIDASTLRQP